ncbi:MAG: pyruvate dehydrogenase (acetyl-transferring) E1 component subunit alpha [Anaerolineae bacterium]|nr:pyruvate dehydrogenase (acetyl-transferring) E1 component subunit alpha [Anaerolineae bacterium]
MATKTESLTKETLLDWYHDIVLIRHFEDRCHHLYFEEKDPARKITGVYLHLATGSEATHVGAVKALGEDDHVITAYRDHGIAIARGVNPDRVMAEMMGKRTGTSGGKGGSMHLADRDLNFWGGYAIVGGHLPLAAGIALKEQYVKSGNAVLCFVGDGALNNGYFHETANMAQVWKLPIVFLVENNLVGMGTRIEESSGQTNPIKRAVGYGMKEGPSVDGQDVVEVYEAVKAELDWSRENGPVLMEARTYRFEGHGVSDKAFNAREDLKGELAIWEARDPINVLTARIKKKYKDVDETLAALDAEAVRIVDESVEYAVSSPAPDYNDLIANVYVGFEAGV